MSFVFNGYQEQERAPVEVRENSQASIVAEILEGQARGRTIPQGQTAVEQSCRWYWSAGLAMGEVTPVNGRTAALTPAFMAALGGYLYDHGEAVYLIGVQDGEITLTPAADWDVQRGGRYRLDIAQPETVETHHVRADGVVHVRIGSPRTAPWTGKAPIRGSAPITSALLATVETKLRQAANASHGTLIGAPDGSDFEQLQGDLSDLEGDNAFMPISYESDSPGSRSQSEFIPRQIHFAPDQNAVMLRKDLCNDTANASGIPAGLLTASTDGTKARESYRQWLFTCMTPLARQMLPEFRRKLGAPNLQIDFMGLAAADIASRARAVKDLVAGGESLEDARRYVGLSNA